MVIDQGRQVFLGPAKATRAYFEGLGFKDRPRQTTPDYLTGCTDSFEREYKPGMSEENAPSDPESLARAFDNSVFAHQLSEEKSSYRKSLENEKKTYTDFETAQHEAKRKHTSKASVYGTPFYRQIWALMKRQFSLNGRTNFVLEFVSHFYNCCYHASNCLDQLALYVCRCLYKK